MLNIRKMIQEEIRKYFDAHLEGLSAKTYDEDGNMISSSYFYKVEDGHWVNIKTNKEFDAFSEQIRTHQNFKSATSLSSDIQKIDTDYDKENLFKFWKNKLSKKEIDEKWSQKYKRSINCNNPKGFSQRAHCQGRKKKQ